MRFLISLLLLFPGSAWAVEYVVLGAAVETNGWVLRLTNATAPNLDATTAANTNLQFFNGFTGNNEPSSTNGLTLTFTSMGFDDAGNGVQVPRTIYGTKLLRRPYPMQNTNDVQPDAVTNCVLRIALSDFVSGCDSNLAMSLRLGAVASTNGTPTNCMSTNLTVINESMQTYGNTVGNWSWRGYRVIDEEYMTLRAVAFQRNGQKGRPIRAAMFWVTDSAATSLTNWQTVPIIDRTMPDANPVQEYIAKFATNTLASGLVVCHVRFYPWVGSNAVDSAAGFLDPTPFLCPLTNAVNYQRVRAVVSPAGNDTTGRAYTEAAWALDQNPPEFATIGKAMSLIYATNSSHYSRNGWGGGIVYLKDGNYTWFGSSVSLANGPDVELLLTPYPGQTAVAITSTAGDITATNYKDIWRWKNIALGEYNEYVIQICAQAWLENVTVTNITGAGTWSWIDGVAPNPMSVILTGCTVSNIMGGLAPNSPADSAFLTLVRGCTLLTNVTPIDLFTFVGNKHTNTVSNAVSLRNDYDSMGSPKSFPGIVAYNTFYNGYHSFHIGNYNVLTNGFALVQNVFECGSTNVIYTRAYLCSDSIGSSNVIVWNNVVAGTSQLTAYNADGSAPIYHMGWSVRNNIWDCLEIKSDTSTTANAGRVGNWAAMYGVGWSGNAACDVLSTISWPEFPGLNGFADNTLRSTNWWKAVRHGGYMGFDGSAHVLGASPGDFRMLSDSPLWQSNRCDQLLPFDLEGMPRGDMDPPGAYTAGNVRKGGFF